jgi:2-methylcitrate dehydratase
MDGTTRKLAAFTASFRYENLSASAIHATRRLMVDTIGCAVGGYHSEPARIARRLAARTVSNPPGLVWGSGAASSLEAAAFANGVMVRYLDFNDTYMSVEVGHPSDFIPAILVAAESVGANGKQALLAIVTGCEVFASLADACNLFRKGFDHGLYIGLAAAAGAARVLGLNEEQSGNAIALACTANVPLRQTRSGALTMWKGCAAPAAAKDGLFAALLAREGMTGPSAAFEGRHGLWDQVTGRFDPAPLGEGSTLGVERTGFKYFPTEYNSLVLLELMLKLRPQVRLEEIESIHVDTYHFTYAEIGSEPAKWRPTTRETADHSLPYMLAVLLMDGGVTVQSFSEERIRDPLLPQLMDRIHIRENDEFTAKYPHSIEGRIEVRTLGGRRVSESGSYPLGHPRNPMSDEQISTKYRKLCRGVMAEGRAEAILEGLWSMDQYDDIRKLTSLIRIEET